MTRTGLNDLLALAGLALVFAGCWRICPPAAMILAGVLLFLVAVRGHHNAATRADRRD